MVCYCETFYIISKRQNCFMLRIKHFNIKEKWWLRNQSQDQVESFSCWLNVEGKWNYKITFVKVLMKLCKKLSVGFKPTRYKADRLTRCIHGATVNIPPFFFFFSAQEGKYNYTMEGSPCDLMHWPLPNDETSDNVWYFRQRCSTSIYNVFTRNFWLTGNSGAQTPLRNN